MRPCFPLWSGYLSVPPAFPPTLGTSKIQLPEIDSLGSEVARNALDLLEPQRSLAPRRELKAADHGQLGLKAEDETREAAARARFCPLLPPLHPVSPSRLPVAVHRLYRVAPNFQLPVDLAELDVRVQHERLCPATASRHHDAPSVGTCPGRTVGKRLAQATMRLGRGGRWHSSQTGQGLDAGKRVPSQGCPVTGWRRQ